MIAVKACCSSGIAPVPSITQEVSELRIRAAVNVSRPTSQSNHFYNKLYRTSLLRFTAIPASQRCSVLSFKAHRIASAQRSAGDLFGLRSLLLDLPFAL
jgi:hypothetical protein